jgi:hypothetical protein
MANNTTSRDENDLYSTLPLDGRKIRVIDIYQNPVSQFPIDSTLLGQLRVVALSDKPKYVAISYAWGSRGMDNSPYSIQFYASTWLVRIRITETAYQAISDVRDHYKGQLTLWIDTICINQNDNLEKQIQIPLMGEIYSGAEIVYVHLGRTEITSDAFDWMTRISQRGYRGTGILEPAQRGSTKRSTYLLVWTNFCTGEEPKSR